MAPLLAHLRGLGVTAIAASEPVNAVERLLADYARFLVRERGFAGATVQRYVGFARRFVAQRAGTDGEVDLAGLSPEEVTQFVLRECSERVPGSAKCGLTRLRSLLRFLHVEGRAPELAWAVPSGPSWRLASLPKGIDRRQVTALLASCDRRTAVGRRDFAILTMLVRLGLRCGRWPTWSSPTLTGVQARSWCAAKDPGKNAFRSPSTSAKRWRDGCAVVGPAAAARRYSPACSRLIEGTRAAPCPRSWSARQSAPGCRPSERTGFAPRWARSFGIGARCRRRFTPRSTSPRCPKSHGTSSRS